MMDALSFTVMMTEVFNAHWVHGRGVWRATAFDKAYVIAPTFIPDGQPGEHHLSRLVVKLFDVDNERRGNVPLVDIGTLEPSAGRIISRKEASVFLTKALLSDGQPMDE